MDLEEYLESEKKKNLQAGFLFFCMMLIHVVAGYCAPAIVYEKVAYNILYSQGLIIVPVICFFIFIKKNPLKYIHIKKINGVSVILLIVLTYCMLPLMSLINLFSMLFVKNHTTELVNNSVTSYGLIGSALLFALTPALVEEIAYRGVFYQSARGKRPIRAMIVSGLLFGAMHMNFNQILYACVMGVIFAIVIEATDSLVSTMIMHFVFNFNSVFLLWVLNKIMNSEFYKKMMELNGEQDIMAEVAETEINIGTIASCAFMAAIGLLVGYFVLKGIAKLNGRQEHLTTLFARKNKDDSQKTEENPDEEEPKTKIWNIWYTLGILICVAMAVLQEIASRV